MGEAMVLPRPKTMFTTPEESFLNASSNGADQQHPMFAGLKIAVFPIIIAGINRQKVSLSG